MRVAWFTPLAARSAIAEFSDHVTQALAGHCDVELWSAEEDERRQTSLPVVDYRTGPLPVDRLREYDAVVYNIGDHLGFHGTIFEASQVVPGIVILHDRICHNLFFNYWMTAGRPDRYVDLMEDFYGAVGRQAAEASFAGLRAAVWASDDELVRFPLFEEALVGARGVVVHSHSHAELVRSRWFGPVETLFLPAYPPTGSPGRLPASLARDERTTIVTVGYVNPNKQVDEVLRALGHDRGLASRVRYLVVGPYDPASPYWGTLQNLILEHDLGDVVQLLGYQPGPVLASLLAEADACINLRYPSFEGGSASLMQQFELGKPVVVAESGSFAELPDDVAAKVPPGDEAALRDALERIVGDEQFRHSLGTAAKEYAASRSPERYARELLAFFHEARSWEPVLEVVDRVADEIAAFGFGEDIGVVKLVERELEAFIAPAGLTARLALRILGESDRDALTRFFVRNDVPEVTSSFDPFPLSPETAGRIARGQTSDRYYGAFLGDRIVGMAMLRGWDDGYDVPSFGVVVDHELHGHGIGARLTDFAIDEARRLGCDRVRLSVYASNGRAHEMYVRRGFVELEREPITHNGAADERVVMTKALRDGA